MESQARDLMTTSAKYIKPVSIVSILPFIVSFMLLPATFFSAELEKEDASMTFVQDMWATRLNLLKVWRDEMLSLKVFEHCVTLVWPKIYIFSSTTFFYKFPYGFGFMNLLCTLYVLESLNFTEPPFETSSLG